MSRSFAFFPALAALAVGKATGYRRHFTVAAGRDSDELVLRVHLADEKGEVEYGQTFRREQ